jgi:hypothetical protein
MHSIIIDLYDMRLWNIRLNEIGSDDFFNCVS